MRLPPRQMQRPEERERVVEGFVCVNCEPPPQVPHHLKSFHHHKSYRHRTFHQHLETSGT